MALPTSVSTSSRPNTGTSYQPSRVSVQYLGVTAIISNCLLLVMIYDEQKTWRIDPGLLALLIVEHLLLLARNSLAWFIPPVSDVDPVIWSILFCRHLLSGSAHRFVTCNHVVRTYSLVNSLWWSLANGNWITCLETSSYFEACCLCKIKQEPAFCSCWQGTRLPRSCPQLLRNVISFYICILLRNCLYYRTLPSVLEWLATGGISTVSWALLLSLREASESSSVESG